MMPATDFWGSAIDGGSASLRYTRDVHCSGTEQLSQVLLRVDQGHGGSGNLKIVFA
jgi:hypothetical protein